MFPTSGDSTPRSQDVLRLEAQLLDLTRDAILVRELGSGVILSWNRGAEELYGWTRAEAVGRSAHELLHTEYPRPLAEIEEELARTGRWDGELQHTTRDGRRVVVASRWAAQHDTHDRPMAHLEMNTNITQEKRAWEEQARLLQETESAEALFHGVLESAPDAIVMTDEDGRIILLNRQTEVLLGYDRDELLGQSVEMLVPASLRDRHVGERATYYADPHTRLMGQGLALSARCKDGTDVPVEISLSAAHVRGQLLVTSILRDVSDQRRLLEELRTTAARLEQQAGELARSNAELEQFASVASHDLQEPLRMVASYTQLLARRYKGRLDDDADEFIGFAVDGAKRMQELINDLLAFSRVGTRGKPFEPTNLEAVFDTVLRDLQPAIQESHATVTRDELPTVPADAGQMQQLLQNLVGNTIKFHGDAPPEVHVSAERQGAMWTLDVQDNGIGIEPAYHERIFALFERLHTRQEYPGTGIGLSICKKIVERHGGRIWVASEPGHGTTFRWTLPAERAEDTL